MASGPPLSPIIAFWLFRTGEKPNSWNGLRHAGMLLDGFVGFVVGFRLLMRASTGYGLDPGAPAQMTQLGKWARRSSRRSGSIAVGPGQPRVTGYLGASWRTRLRCEYRLSCERRMG
jgi:hypothetical protein